MSTVESVVELLLGKLAEALIGEAIFLHGVRDQVELLALEFERMVAFLEDADSKQEGDRRVKRWVQHVRDVAYDAEDVIDTFILKIATSKRREFLGCIKRYACIPVELKALHDVGSEIQRINNKIHRISESMSTYGINMGQEAGKSSADPILQEQRLTSPNFEEAEFVGFQEDSGELVKKLTNEGELRRCVVSVVGMGGLGKTTLTKKLYNDGTVKKHFHIHAWISVSQEYSARDLLQTITKRCMVLSQEELEKVEKMDVLQLRDKISEYLNDKRYLVVLDDIWKKEAWDALKDAFPDVNNGSRVVLTTRIKDVALYADPRSQLHELRLLTNEESWDLLCKKTLILGRDGGCPQDLEKQGREIVKKCGGLPLAVVVIGGLLRTKTKEAGEWKKVHDSISWHLVEGEFNISDILSLSYKDLPYYLKPCFLYLGNFPEDYEFHGKKLIQMWAAEGFLEERGEETLEEVGEDYLMQLIQRSMVQVTERSSSRGIKKCRIHDLLRDLSISESKEGMFLQVHSRINANAPPASRARRLAIHHNNSSKYISLSCSTPHLIRSVLMYTQGHVGLQRGEEKFLYRGFKLLRVLCLDGVRIKKLPRDIGELIHLRYLGCTQTYLEGLPSSIFNLPNLQTLFVPSGYRIKVPSTIGKMQQLRHLQLGWAVMKGHPRLEQISNLQTLSKVKAGKWMEGRLGNLTNLRKLGIVLVTTADAKVFNDSILKLGYLHSLSVSVPNEKLWVVPTSFFKFKIGKQLESLESQEWPLPPFLNLFKLSKSYWSLPPFSNLLNLSKLYLDGNLEKLPESAQFPVNLTKLTLKWSRLSQDPLATLEKLEKLRILKLQYSSYKGKEMVCSSQGFPQLESLHLQDLRELEEWRVEKGAMPNLLKLRIDWCRQLKKLPEGLQHVTTLKKLELRSMLYEFVKRLKEERGEGEGEGEDWHKIRHVPSIDIRNTRDSPLSPGEATTPSAASATEEEKKEEPAKESDDVVVPISAGEAAAPAAACAAEEKKKEEPAEESADDVVAPVSVAPVVVCATEEEKKGESAEESDDVAAPVSAGEAVAPAAACAAEEEKKKEPAEESNDD